MQNDLLTNGFDAFLKTLEADRDTAAEKYILLRERLERFFEWRNCENIEGLTDIVFDRVSKKIREGEKIENPEAYCVSVAKFVLLENRRNEFRSVELNEDSLKMIGRGGGKGDGDDLDGLADKRFRCLDSCLAKLPEDKRKLIIKYFDTDEATMINTRKRIADKQGISLNTLRIRVCRLKSKLETCTKKCCGSE